METHRACQDIDATRVSVGMGTGLAVGFEYETTDSFSPELCIDSVVSKEDAVAKLEQVVQGYCNREGTKTCVRVGPVRVCTVGKFQLWVENTFGYLFSYSAEQR